jgi:uncharacterized protein
VTRAARQAPAWCAWTLLFAVGVCNLAAQQIEFPTGPPSDKPRFTRASEFPRDFEKRPTARELPVGSSISVVGRYVYFSDTAALKTGGYERIGLVTVERDPKKHYKTSATDDLCSVAAAHGGDVIALASNWSGDRRYSVRGECDGWTTHRETRFCRPGAPLNCVSEQVEVRDCYHWERVDVVVPVAFSAASVWRLEPELLRAKRAAATEGEDRSAALSAAVESGDAALVRQLLNSGARPSWQALMSKAVQQGSVDIVALFLEEGVSPNGLTDRPLLLELAEKDESPERLAVARLLLSHGAEVDPRDARGRTLLTLAAFYGRPGIVELLLRAGANPNATFPPDSTYRLEDDASTPLGLAAALALWGNAAAKNRALGVVRLLLAHGADPSAHSQTGKSALQVARELARTYPSDTLVLGLLERR